MKQAETIKWGRWRIAWACLANLDAVAELLRTGEIDGVGLSPHHGYTGDPAFLNDLPTFAGIVVTEPAVFDIRAIPRPNELRFITIASARLRGNDFSVFCNLDHLGIHWHPADVLPSDSSILSSLYLYGFKPKTKDVTSLPKFGKGGQAIKKKRIDPVPPFRSRVPATDPVPATLTDSNDFPAQAPRPQEPVRVRQTKARFPCRCGRFEATASNPRPATTG